MQKVMLQCVRYNKTHGLVLLLVNFTFRKPFYHHTKISKNLTTLSRSAKHYLQVPIQYISLEWVTALNPTLSVASWITGQTLSYRLLLLSVYATPSSKMPMVPEMRDVTYVVCKCKPKAVITPDYQWRDNSSTSSSTSAMVITAFITTLFLSTKIGTNFWPSHQLPFGLMPQDKPSLLQFRLVA